MYSKIEVIEETSLKPPNGGLRAWFVVSGACAAQMCTTGYINSFGIYQSYYSTHHLSEYPPSQISWIGSIQTFFLFFLGLFSGPLCDRYGVKTILIPAGIALLLSVLMTSISTQYYQILLTQGVLGGVASGMIFTPMVSIVGQYFTTHCAWAIGIVLGGSSVGGVIFPITLITLFPLLQFAWVVRIVALIILVLVVYSAVACREFAHRNTKFFLPSAFEQTPYNLVNLAFFVGLMGLYTPIFYITSYSLSRGMDPGLASHQVMVLNTASLFGRLVPTFIGDRYGRFNMSIMAYLCCGILCFTWTLATSTTGIIVWGVLYGFWSGASISLYPPTVAQICLNVSDIGTYIGQGLAVSSFGSLAGAPISGALIRQYGYRSASMFTGVALILAVCSLTWARFLLEKRVFSVI